MSHKIRHGFDQVTGGCQTAGKLSPSEVFARISTIAAFVNMQDTRTFASDQLVRLKSLPHKVTVLNLFVPATLT